MTKLLLDTHAFLWYFQGSSNFSNTLREMLESRENQVHLSIVSLWEIAIKIGIGKLEIPASFSELEAVLSEFGIDILFISLSQHASRNYPL